MPFPRRRFSGDGNYAPRMPFALNVDSAVGQHVKYMWTGLVPGKVLSMGRLGSDGIIEVAGPDWAVSPDVSAQVFRTLDSNNRVAQLGDIVLDDFTAIWRGIPISSATTTAFGFDDFGETDITSGRDTLIYKPENNGGASEINVAGTGFTTTSIGSSLGKFGVFAITRKGTAGEIFLNSISKDTGTVGSGNGRVFQFGRLGGHRFSGSTQEEYEAHHVDLIFLDYPASDSVIDTFFDPSTRWDLYWQPGRVTYFVPAAVAVVGKLRSLLLMNVGS